MAFVDRDKSGAVVAAYATRQRPGQEERADTAPEVVALRNPQPSALERRRAEYPGAAAIASAYGAAILALVAGTKVPDDALAVLRQVAAVDAKFPLE